MLLMSVSPPAGNEFVVLPALTCMPGGFEAAGLKPTSWVVFCAAMHVCEKRRKQLKVRQERAGCVPLSPELLARIREECPWLTEHDICEAVKNIASPGASRVTTGPGTMKRTLTTDEVEDTVFAEVRLDMERHREDWQFDDDDEEQRPFMWFVAEAAGPRSSRAVPSTPAWRKGAATLQICVSSSSGRQ